jgi:CubicO group peptidase (beta-lactamase class C family)
MTSYEEIAALNTKVEHTAERYRTLLEINNAIITHLTPETLLQAVSEILRRVIALPAEAPCGARVLYSDPGYVLLGEVLRTVSGGKGIAELFAERIAAPLGLQSIGFRPATMLRDLDRIAPTEDGNRHEAELAARLAQSSDDSAREQARMSGPDPARFRTGLIRGEVHDGNAHALGGAAGHAGLFGNAADVARLARQFLEGDHRPRLFGAQTLSLFRQSGTPGLEEARSVGWKLARAGCREAEGVLSPDSFGHTGFTGTSLYIDPVSGRSYVLLTNRVHPRVRPIDMNGLRRRFHEIASRLP